MQRLEVVGYLEERFPRVLAEEWDRTGLQVGTLQGPCRRVLVALDLALAHLPLLVGVDLVVVHHPLLFQPLEAVRPETPLGQKLRALLAAGTALYALHTPYDAAQGGLNDLLAAHLGLQGTRPLRPRGRLFKLVVYVPPSHEEAVAQALFRAGAGKIGKYGHCSFRTRGTGTFLPEEGAQPFLGAVGREEHVEEVRLETIVPEERVEGAVQAMLEAHPYEEVAYDVYPLAHRVGFHGLGRVGTLPAPVPAAALVQTFAERLGMEGPKAVFGPTERAVTRVAVCGGSAGDLVPAALQAQAELLLAGEMGYHRVQEAVEAGLTVALFGHAETERPFVGHVAQLLRERFPGLEVIQG
ncbi:MAG: Nif3-like dinuclear metal center hexameric protein [Candidatus Bipolaricaulota bacterium]|nr:Nif3-like dinuclear metal center hexameric protein [Candidatus Bipolaricaulota bacterium]MDW8152373.1 Nif3-like dinuclear metal center hexameric protein [Candidatus Bipolaricaulota bacterium]